MCCLQSGHECLGELEGTTGGAQVEGRSRCRWGGEGWGLEKVGGYDRWPANGGEVLVQVEECGVG